MIEVRTGTAADADRIAVVMATAFQDDPGTVIFEPDPARRSAFLPSFFRAIALATLADGGSLIVPSGALDGVATWFGPGRYGPTEAALVANGFEDALSLLGAVGADRVVRMIGELEAQHDRLMAGRPHLRLDFFAVDPATQGHGVGGALISWGHRRAEALGLPVYLETFTERNVRFYERRGYGLLATFLVADETAVYAMERPLTE